MSGRSRWGGVWAVLCAVLVVSCASPVALPEGSGASGQALHSRRPRVFYPPDVVGQFKAITDRADALGFGIGDSPDPSLCRHYQGIARSSGEGTPYLFVSRSGNQPPAPCIQWCEEHNAPCSEVGDGPGNLLVVRMASRETDGERLRSNRLRHGTETADSAPYAGDEVVRTITFDGQNGWPRYGHPGGMQLVDDVLVVPLEAPYVGDADVNEVLFLDVRQPEDPRIVSRFPVRTSENFTAGLVAVTPLPDGRYLMLLAGLKNKEVRFFESNDAPEGLRDPGLTWTFKQFFLPDQDALTSQCQILAPGQHPDYPNGLYRGWPGGGLLDVGYQSINFVREGGPNGALFMVGGRSTSQVPGLGDDYFDLWRVTYDGQRYQLGCEALRHVYTFPSSDGALLFHNNLAHFAAATGAYVSPSGELILYGTEHDNDGPGGTVKLGEWRHRDIVRPGSPTYNPWVKAGGAVSVLEGSTATLTASAEPAKTRAWIQLWTDPDWRDDRYLVIDSRDWGRDDFDNFKRLDDAQNNPFATGFSDQATSARWFAPVGCTLRLNDDDFGDSDFPGSDTRTIPGTGGVSGVAHLSDFRNDSDSGNLNDALTSAQFFGNCDTYYARASLALEWDLDGNGSYEAAGSPASFSAAALDGPSNVTVPARARHLGDGRTGSGAVEVRVVNVEPWVRPMRVTDGAGRVVGVEAPFALVGLPLTLTDTFSDPGVADTHTARIDWGDGAVALMAQLDAFSPATGGLLGSLRDTHVYLTAGSYEPRVSVTDDDSGVGVNSATVRVMDARGAVGEVIATLEALAAGATGATRTALLDALVRLRGNGAGDATNGVLDALDKGQLLNAVRRLAEAIEALERAEAASGTSYAALQASLALAAQSLVQTAYAAAQAALTSPTTAQAAKLSAVGAAIQSGAARLSTQGFSEAMADFARAAQDLETLLR